MHHFGCEDWTCVEAPFQDGGAYAGMWGWLYILQMAQDGDKLTASYGWSGDPLRGIFQRSQNGSIDLKVGDSWVWPSAVFAFYPAKGHFAGSYSLNIGSPNAAFTAVGTKHQFRVLPSQIDKKGAGLGVVKAGTEFGPQMVESGQPGVVAVGLAWTAAGAAATLYTDLIHPIYETIQGNTAPTVDLIVDKTIEFITERYAPRAAPYASPATDIARSIWPALCWGTQCFGK
jgi:hypothetical protein